MKQYLNLDTFTSFISNLEENKPKKLFTESFEDGSIEEYLFMKTKFDSLPIILYTHPYCYVDIIQDTPVAPLEDYIEGVFNTFTGEEEYKIFIEVGLIEEQP